MSDRGDVRKRQILLPIHFDVQDRLFVSLCEELFASLPRADQRRKGVDYVRGLLRTPGRKSIRNMAATLGPPATEQSLHHFISDSTWDWVPVRQALARYVTRGLPPRAWVVRPVVIPKAGQHSVGVGRRFCPSLGQALNAQQAVGVWTCSDRLCVPVDWRLHLSKAWMDDSRRRDRASIPHGLGAETLGDCAVEAYNSLAGYGLPTRPVVLDARELDAVAVVRGLRAAGTPMLVRITNTVPLSVTGPAPPGYHSDMLSAYKVMLVTADLRRPVVWTESGSATPMTSLVATVPVRLPAGPDGPPVGDLLLIGAGKIGQPWPGELWLTDLSTVEPGALLPLTRLISRVDREFIDVTDQVGIRDFAGRSYSGWHRHVTLASAAHFLAALSTTADRRLVDVC